MAFYRNIHINYWTDSKVEDDFTPEDKYFYLYLLTNPQTNISGCYEISYSQTARHLGYDKETVKRLLERFEYVHNIIRFNKDTKELLIINWYKYNWAKSDKVFKGVLSVCKHLKTKEFRQYIEDVVKYLKDDAISIPYIKHIQTTVTVTVSDSVTETVSDTVAVTDPVTDPVTVNRDSNIYCAEKPKKTDKYKDIRERIIDYLNQRCSKNYRSTTRETVSFINGRLNEGYTEQDFITVIDKKANEWLGTEQEKYLRPSTLFNQSKFESYLNQSDIRIRPKNINESRQSQFEYLMQSIKEDMENEQAGNEKDHSVYDGDISNL